MTLKQFVEGLTQAQRDYFVDYIEQMQTRAEKYGYKQGFAAGLYAVRNKINDEFGL